LPTGHIASKYSVIKQPGEVITFAVPADKNTATPRPAMNRIAQGQGIEPPQAWDGEKKGVKADPAVARMADPLWWRRKLPVFETITVLVNSDLTYWQ
jgi:hypothetical protein